MKIAFLASTALVLTTLTATPAMAQLSPEAQMESICSATDIVNPDPNSTYRAEPSSVSTSVGAPYEKSRVTTAETPGGILLSKTPPVFTAGSETRNGGSPNIHGTFVSTATYSGGSKTQLVTNAQDTTYTFGCRVFKIHKNGNVTQPPGLQVPATLTVLTTAILGTETVTVSNPDVTHPFTSGGVICNSPGSKGGQWRNQNGYGGECSTVRYLALGVGADVHNNSNSVPGLVTEPDHNRGNSDHADMPQSVTDNDHDVVETSGDAPTAE